MISRILIFLSVFSYISLALWNPFIDKNINLNKDLVDKLVFVKKERSRNSNYKKEEIAFLKKYNLALDSSNITKNYVLNVTVEKNLNNLKRAITYLENKGYRALYYKFDSFYYIVIGYFDTLEKTLEAKRELREFKNVYPVHL